MFISIVLLLIVIANTAWTEDISISKKWEAKGFEHPESVVFDTSRNISYVSNINGEPDKHDSNGYISKLGMDGKIVEKKWITGLDAPKGLVIYKNILYVSDINRLVAIDTIKGKIIHEYEAKDAKFLNDVTVDCVGNVYVSDMNDNAIYRLKNNKFSIWLKDENLGSPNGLCIEYNKLFVVTVTDNKGAGNVKVIDICSKCYHVYAPEGPFGTLDGIETDGKGGFFITDWNAGKLYYLGANKKTLEIKSFNQGSADIEYLPRKKLLFVPLMLDNEVVLFSL